MTDLELANSVLKDIRNQNRSKAATSIQTLLDKNADLKENWGGITRLAISIGEYNNAIACSKKFLNIAPNEPRRIIQCAGILAECREIKSAIALVTPLLKGNVTPDILHFLGTTHSQIGNIELAKKYLVELINIVPTSAISWLTLAAVHTFSENDPLYQHISDLKEQLEQAPKAQHAPYWFALGKAALDIKDSQQAFTYFSKACKLMHNEKAYEAKQHGQFIDDIIKHQNADYLNTLPNLEQTTHCAPIFIIGLPRSGTTLLQQVLSAHSKIGQGGELKYFSHATSQIGQVKLNNLAEQNQEQQMATLKTIQSNYQHMLSQQFPTDQPVVDKTLNLNHHLGLVSKIFPNAAMIRITRKSEDNAWSCYRNFFNQGLGWSYNLENIAEFFHHESRLTKHWQSLLGARILEISYEDLINQPEATIALCLEHIGLTYEPSMLSFHTNNALVQTASVGQVRREINTDSMNTSLALKQHLTPFTKRFQALNDTL